MLVGFRIPQKDGCCHTFVQQHYASSHVVQTVFKRLTYLVANMSPRLPEDKDSYPELADGHKR